MVSFARRSKISDEAVHEITMDMETTSMTDRRRPFEIVQSNGPPHNPIPFGAPIIDRGRRDMVLAFDSSTQQHQQLENVLFRDEQHIETAYFPVPNKQAIKTIMGHVQICLVLRPCVKERDSDEEESENESEGEDDLVFELTSQYVAIKVNYCARIEALRNKHAEDPMKEIAAMQWIGNDHPHVLGCLEVLFDGSNINVVLPFCRDGDLFELLQETQKQPTPGLDESRAKVYFRQILLGLQHMQERGVCHRDLSPENVMMDQDGCIVIDMGMCLRIPYLDGCGTIGDISIGGRRLLMSPQGTCGKLSYMAPEIYANRVPFDGEAVDIWSCGTILFCMLTGNRSYQRAHNSDPQFYWMTHGIEALLKDWDVKLSKIAVELLQGMLTIDPRKRLTLDEVLTHKWFE